MCYTYIRRKGNRPRRMKNFINGSVPEWPKGADCKSVVCDFGGPNPPAPTKILVRKNEDFFCFLLQNIPVIYLQSEFRMIY